MVTLPLVPVRLMTLAFMTKLWLAASVPPPRLRLMARLQRGGIPTRDISYRQQAARQVIPTAVVATARVLSARVCLIGQQCPQGHHSTRLINMVVRVTGVLGVARNGERPAGDVGCTQGVAVGRGQIEIPGDSHRSAVGNRERGALPEPRGAADTDRGIGKRGMPL